jgi:transposase
MPGEAMHHVGGGDWSTPLPAVSYSEPKPKPRGLDWSKHRAPEPPRPPVVERPEATVTEIQKRVARPAARKKRRPATCTSTPRKTRTSVVDVPVASAEYLEGATCPEIADRHGWPVISVRRQLAKAGVQMRDDRHSRSGGKPKVYDPQLVAKVRALYVDQGMSQAEIAERIGRTPKVVQHLMKREGIPARKGASGGGDTLQGYRDRLNELGVTSTQVRAWARATGHPVSPRGVIGAHVVDAYEAAHQTTTQDPTQEGKTA